MNRLEDELRNALRREEPSEGFAERVLARAAAKPPRAFRWPALRWAMAIAAMLVLVAGVAYHRARQERIQGERAKQQIVLALKITSSKLRLVRETVDAIQ